MRIKSLMSDRWDKRNWHQPNRKRNRSATKDSNPTSTNSCYACSLHSKWVEFGSCVLLWPKRQCSSWSRGCRWDHSKVRTYPTDVWSLISISRVWQVPTTSTYPRALSADRLPRVLRLALVSEAKVKTIVRALRLNAWNDDLLKFRVTETSPLPCRDRSEPSNVIPYLSTFDWWAILGTKDVQRLKKQRNKHRTVPTLKHQSLKLVDATCFEMTWSLVHCVYRVMR